MGVTCKNCGFDNEPGAKFCIRCGQALVHIGEVTHPRFVTGKLGRPYCASHTSFDGQQLDAYDGEIINRPLRAHSLTCATCEQYHKDDCYFSTGSLRDIITRIFKRSVRCDFCTAWYTASPVVVLQKIYWEQVSGGKGYIACPHCDHFLKTAQNSRKRYSKLIIRGLFPTITAFAFILMALFTIYIGENPITQFSLYILMAILLILLGFKWYGLITAFLEKRRNLKEFLLALNHGQNSQIFLSVD